MSNWLFFGRGARGIFLHRRIPTTPKYLILDYPQIRIGSGSGVPVDVPSLLGSIPRVHVFLFVSALFFLFFLAFSCRLGHYFQISQHAWKSFSLPDT